MSAGPGQRAARPALAGVLLAALVLLPAGGLRSATAGTAVGAPPPLPRPAPPSAPAAGPDTAPAARAAEPPADPPVPIPHAADPEWKAPEWKWSRCRPAAGSTAERAPEPGPCAVGRAGARGAGLAPPSRPLLLPRAFLEWQLRDCHEREDVGAGP